MNKSEDDINQYTFLQTNVKDCCGKSILLIFKENGKKIGDVNESHLVELLSSEKRYYKSYYYRSYFDRYCYLPESKNYIVLAFSSKSAKKAYLDNKKEFASLYYGYFENCKNEDLNSKKTEQTNNHRTELKDGDFTYHSQNSFGKSVAICALSISLIGAVIDKDISQHNLAIAKYPYETSDEPLDLAEPESSKHNKTLNQGAKLSLKPIRKMGNANTKGFRSNTVEATTNYHRNNYYW